MPTNSFSAKYTSCERLIQTLLANVSDSKLSRNFFLSLKQYCNCQLIACESLEDRDRYLAIAVKFCMNEHFLLSPHTHDSLQESQLRMISLCKYLMALAYMFCDPRLYYGFAWYRNHLFGVPSGLPKEGNHFIKCATQCPYKKSYSAILWIFILVLSRKFWGE